MQGFRAAQAFVEVSARLDDDKVLAAARRAAQNMERELTAGGERSGRGITAALERAGTDAGTALVAGVDGRMRDAKGRFVGAGAKIGEDVSKGAEGESHRSGFRAFAGLLKAAPKAGFDAATGLIGALRQGISGPAGPYLIAGMTAGAIVAGPVIGGVLAGGILAGLAVGAIGLGVATQMKDPEIKHAATETGASIGAVLTRATTPFKGALLTTFREGGLAFARWEPQLHTISALASTMLNPLVNGLIRMVDQILPRMPAALKAAEPVIGAIGDGLSTVGDAIGDVIEELSDNGPEAAVAMKAAFWLVGDTIRMVGGTINFLTEGLGAVIDLALSMGDLMVDVGAAAQTIPGPIGEIGDKLVGVGSAIQGGKERWEAFKERSKSATDTAGAGTTALSERTKLLSLSMGAAIEQAGGLSAAFKALNGGALSAREAESAYQAAIDNVSASIKANGKTLDLHTEKGRNNDAAIRQLISTTDAKAQATYDEINATKGAAAAEAAAKGVYEQGRQQLVKNLTQILGNKDAAVALANKIMGIPKSWGTTVSLTDMASKKAQAIRTEISKINGKTVVIHVKYETSGNAQGEHIIGQGTQLKDRWGGVHEGGVTKAATGLVRDAAMFGPRSPGHYLIAEPETGGELFAPKRGDMRRIRSMVSYAIENWWGGWDGFMPKGRRGPSGPLPTGAGAPAGGSATHVTFGPGSVVLDASKIQSIQDVLDLITNLIPTARTYRLGGTR